MVEDLIPGPPSADLAAGQTTTTQGPGRVRVKTAGRKYRFFRNFSSCLRRADFNSLAGEDKNYQAAQTATILVLFAGF